MNQQRIDADDESGGERPGELARSASDAEEIHDGRDEEPLEQGGVARLFGDLQLRVGGFVHACRRDAPEKQRPM